MNENSEQSKKNKMTVPLWVLIVSIIGAMALTYFVDSYLDLQRDRVNAAEARENTN